MKPRLPVAVRTLVAFALQSGDLMSTFAGSQRSLEGIRAHQKIQRSRPAGYQPEVTIRHEMETTHFILDISGRLDGVFSDGPRVVIDEIKSTHKDLTMIEKHPTRCTGDRCRPMPGCTPPTMIWTLWTPS